jgi:hypothetical protein
MALSPAPLLNADHLAFIQGDVSIIAAAADADNTPTVMRAIGCRVGADGRMTVLLNAAQSHQLLENVRRSGALALVFSSPTRHRTLQLKAVDAKIVPAGADDARLQADYVERMTREIGVLGFSDALVRTMLNCPPEDLITLVFTPAAAFEQTPGPNAGTPMAAVSGA